MILKIGNKKGDILIIKILGAAAGSTGFIVLALGKDTISLLIGTALIGIGSLLIAAGGSL